MLNSEFARRRGPPPWLPESQREAETCDARIERMYELVLARPPRAREIEQARAFLESPSNAGKDQAAWVDLAVAMLNRNEFLYVP